MSRDSRWAIIHAAHWLVLYAAFVAEIPGAANLAFFAAWVIVVLAVFLLSDFAVAEALKSPPDQRWMVAMTRIQSWSTLAAFVWAAWFATAFAWGLAMLLVALYRDRVAKARQGAASGRMQG